MREVREVQLFALNYVYLHMEYVRARWVATLRVGILFYFHLRVEESAKVFFSVLMFDL